MRQVLIVLIFFMIGSTNSAQNSVDALYPFNTIQQQAQFNHLLKNLRCLVCQNQDLADSNAGLANDLRNEVYRLVQNGQTDDEITHYLTSRYGDFILFNPPIKAITSLLWFGPILFLLIGLSIFWFICIKKKNDD